MRLLVGSAAALALLTVLVATGLTDALDSTVLAALLPFRTPAVTDVLRLIALLGNALVSGALAIALAVRLTMTEGRRGIVPLFLFVGLAGELVARLLVFQPGPPSELVRDSSLFLSLRELAPFTYPSGHVMRVTFLAWVVASRNARLRVPLAIVVAVIAFARIYLAASWIADVAGGVLMGVALAVLAQLVADRIATTRPAPRGALATPLTR